ncbi:NADP-dependent oxidoreductase [Luteimicrobium subarcticum]|uniref:NADPH:quinone reductase-like Zn-dependent oxidoreductase n=1 Tax=Luteimicrobium subarcticum TaxID=620910 RepID=A0A2M8WRR9_9MICO|nr:NADP-dependent oxidoreductase [Luteimicrobium subarcticum]PJI93608.1 NADPH:quinone reductase-like Zn-dependent oxidoreductase [Luteimicrobium subarcticum]
MKVVQQSQYGPADVLEVVEHDTPAAVDGRVRVQVQARALNPADIGTRAGAFAAMTPGLTFPAVLGWDFAGVLLDDATVGGSVGTLAAGTRVAGFVPWFGEALGAGSYTEVLVVDPTWVAPVPDALSTAEAAVLGMNAVTGAHAADMVADLLGVAGGSDALAGRTVLVTGASGPVGAAAVLTLVGRGARVLATGSRGDDESVAALGAEVLPRTDAAGIAAAAREAADGGVDAVFNAGLASHELLAAVRDGGVFVSATRGYMPTAERGVTVDGVHVEPDPERLVALLDEAVAGRLPVRVAKEVPLEDAAAAHALVEAGGVRGKVVLVS